MKGIEKIDAILNNFLKEFGATAKLGEDFACYCQKEKEKVIFYSLYIYEEEHKWFEDNWKTIAPDIVCDPFLSSFFHELGHVVTAKEFSDFEWSEYFVDLANIEATVKPDAKLSDLKEVNELYFQFPIEKRATEWGANYMREHANKVAELWDKLTTAFMEVYELNEVEI